MGTGGTFHKARPDIEKSLDLVFFFIRGTTNYLKLWSVDILSISAEQVSQPAMQVGCLLRFERLLRIF